MASTAIEPRLVFMGTPEFAVPSLRALSAGPYHILVVTQPDRPAGRSAKPSPPPVKVAAQEIGLEVWQPESLRDPEFRARLAEWRPEVTALVAYGEYLAPALLDMPRRGSINLHPSLLPRWRGSTPIQSAILAGDDTTGASIILMDKGLDSGDVLAQRSLKVEPGETYPQLSARLAEMGAALLAETVPLWLRGEITPVPQDGNLVTMTQMLRKEDGLIDWNLPADQISRRIRAFQPWPGTYTYWGDKLLKIISAQPAPEAQNAKPPGAVAVETAVGGGKAMLVWTGQGALEIERAQLEGKPVREARALLSGYPEIAASVLKSVR